VPFKDISIKRNIYSISELTSNIKTLLEEKFPIIWITGEISNFNKPGSGHYYFTLKDDFAQISSVMFKGQNRKLNFLPENGMSITGLGRISVYEPRGSYQIILEHLEPQGIGALQKAFEQLKSQLHKEGLFEEKHKIPIPYLPQKVSIVTSPTGAVVHDIIKIIGRRFSNTNIEITPTKVQGMDAEKQIVSALELANKRKNSDVIILARGGGSLEDLSAFNSEKVARAVFVSEIPVISAVGHETDYTITDFVADLRAPTPSTAAEMVVPVKNELKKKVAELSRRLTRCFNDYIEMYRNYLDEISKRLKDPRRKVEDLRLKADDYTNRLIRIFSYMLAQKKERLAWKIEKLYVNNPVLLIDRLKEKLKYNNNNLVNAQAMVLDIKRSKLKGLTERLHDLSPKSVLDRGYSITRAIPELSVVRDSDLVAIGQNVEVTLARGTIECSVKGKKTNG
jgi:exodeoxyribonuclease VII large subunit